jgi:hypothetical protein
MAEIVNNSILLQPLVNNSVIIPSIHSFLSPISKDSYNWNFAHSQYLHSYSFYRLGFQKAGLAPSTWVLKEAFHYHNYLHLYTEYSRISIARYDIQNVQLLNHIYIHLKSFTIQRRLL